MLSLPHHNKVGRALEPSRQDAVHLVRDIARLMACGAEASGGRPPSMKSYTFYHLLEMVNWPFMAISDIHAIFSDLDTVTSGLLF